MNNERFPKSYIERNRWIECDVAIAKYAQSKYLDAAIRCINIDDVRQYEHYELERALIAVLNQVFNINIFNSHNTFFGFGAFYLIERIFTLLVRPQSALIGAGPQFADAVKACLWRNNRYLCYERTLDSEKNMLEGFIGHIRANHRSASIVYVDNPNNPLGSFIGLDDLSSIAKECEELNMILLVDEAFGDFLPFECSAVSLINKYSNVIVVRSFSKFYGLAGERLGYMVMSDNLVESYSHYNPPFECSGISLKLAAAILLDETYRKETLDTVKQLNCHLSSHLDGTGLGVLPTSPLTNIVTLYQKGANLFEKFKRNNIKVISGQMFSHTHSSFSNEYVRLVLPGNLDVLQLILNRLK